MRSTGRPAQQINQRRDIEHVFRDAIARPGRPGAVAVAAQIHGVDVKMLTEGAGHPIPIARVIQAAVHQEQRRLAVLSPVPELQLQAMGIVIVRDRFQFIYCRRTAPKASRATSAPRKPSEGETNTDGRSKVAVVVIGNTGAMRNGDSQTAAYVGIRNSGKTVETRGEVMIRIE